MEKLTQINTLMFNTKNFKESFPIIRTQF